ncbi:DUF692 domain-containing protein [Leptospira wolffii]|uniref:MNIO family bufferin maturase n=1 Tax=Leptospira wolffii TaxID=409998 RepID=UPI0010835A9C|nr:DUF692 domain-containing protein [Leptospira wolffii]TGK62277.1 DUF692 domain-containing protein [Leptospira wolffii]TGK68206.1 DUF692 domain-containing protein [Leptospira wolffii]TGK74339.1 DUF692 domain-containing protein [Leptospira wolffii]TGL32086.1 DUF692 domain-containing protein [Leptospira wolffii]
MSKIGIGLRREHYAYLREGGKVRAGWFEAITENYMDSKGKPLEMLEFIRADHPIALHGVSLSVLGEKFPDDKYLKNWKELIERIQPFLVSDHLCWTESGDAHLHDLLPFPFTREFLDFASDRVDRIQNVLGRQILLENVSTYLRFKNDSMSEWDFLGELSRRSGCGILLDINNIYVNSVNHGFPAEVYLDSVPWENVKQIHVAGYTDTGDFLFDTHSRPVSEEVWKLAERFSSKLRDLPILLEWDDEIPTFREVEEEAFKMNKILNAENRL